MIENAGKTPSLKDQLKTADLFQRMDLLHEASEYDLLGLFEPGSEDGKKAGALFYLAGSFKPSPASKYFLEKTLNDVLDQWGTEIIDKNGKIVKVISGCFHEENADYAEDAKKVNTSPETVEILRRLADKLEEQERNKDMETYRTIGTSAEGDQLINKETVVENIRQRLHGDYSADEIRRMFFTTW